MNPDLLAAAVMAAGDGCEDADIVDQLVRFSLMSEPESPTTKKVHRVMTAFRFVAELVAVDIEESSTRAVLTLRSDTADSPDGTEQVRTDRTDQPDGRRMAARARELIGRRVLVFKAVEDIGPQKKVRVCVHLIDIGPGRDAIAAGGTHAWDPWVRRHWEEAAAAAGTTGARILAAAAHYAQQQGLPEPRTLDAIDARIAVDIRRWLEKQKATT